MLLHRRSSPDFCGIRGLPGAFRPFERGGGIKMMNDAGKSDSALFFTVSAFFQQSCFSFEIAEPGRAGNNSNYEDLTRINQPIFIRLPAN